MSNANGLAVVTGASAGIGAEFARQLAARGHDLLLVARRENRLKALARELRDEHGVRVTLLVTDLNDLDAADRVAPAVEATGAPLRWLVNNAGYALVGSFEHASLADHRRFIRVMGSAPVEITHAVLPALRRAAPSHIINVGSVASYAPGLPGSGLYASVRDATPKARGRGARPATRMIPGRDQRLPSAASPRVVRDGSRRAALAAPHHRPASRSEIWTHAPGACISDRGPQDDLSEAERIFGYQVDRQEPFSQFAYNCEVMCNELSG